MSNKEDLETQPFTDKALLAALAEASLSAQGPGRQIIFDQLLDELCTKYSDAARVTATVLRGVGSEESVRLAEAITDRVGALDAPPRILKPLSVNVLILTVKPTELTACLRAFDIPRSAKPIDLGDSAEVWVKSDGDLRYAIAYTGFAGNVEAAVTLGLLYSLVDFKAAILIGMAAGVRGLVSLGDIVVAEQVCAYELQKLTKDGPEFGPRAYEPPQKHIRRVGSIDQTDPEWAQRISRELIEQAVLEADGFAGVTGGEEPMSRDWCPKLHIGVILSGSKLIEDGSLVEMKNDLHYRIRAAEMEGAGFAAACKERDVPWVVVRGIADYGEEGREKHWQLPATYAAARFVRDAVKQGRLALGISTEAQ